MSLALASAAQAESIYQIDVGLGSVPVNGTMNVDVYLVVNDNTTPDLTTLVNGDGLFAAGVRLWIDSGPASISGVTPNSALFDDPSGPMIDGLPGPSSNVGLWQLVDSTGVGAGFVGTELKVLLGTFTLSGGGSTGLSSLRATVYDPNLDVTVTWDGSVLDPQLDATATITTTAEVPAVPLPGSVWMGFALLGGVGTFRLVRSRWARA
jgi:hypothetical protein